MTTKPFPWMKAYAEDQRVNNELFWLNKGGRRTGSPSPPPYPASPQASGSPAHVENCRPTAIPLSLKLRKLRPREVT